ncbi:MAG: DUF711 family protein [Proteobacteria bacterium]|nr:DUF711 family protein [Pseudomonadota bacterium]
MGKIVRSICYFSETPGEEVCQRIRAIEQRLKDLDYLIQTMRICSNGKSIVDLENRITDKSLLLSVGRLGREEVRDSIDDFINSDRTSFNLELNDEILPEDVELLYRIVREAPEKTFNFTYAFQNVPSSPYFPSAKYQKEGFAIGLQSTNLSMNCTSLEAWLSEMKQVWEEVVDAFKGESDFLGLDSSVAPLFDGEGSLIRFINSLHGTFSHSVLTDNYVRITNTLKNENPKPVGLCGLMFPCLEDFELAREYENGNFTLERNILLSLNSGLGIDTYPIGVNEDPAVVQNILSLLMKLAGKYRKPLAARFVSDGKSRIGDVSDFRNPYLKDVKIRSLSFS